MHSQEFTQRHFHIFNNWQRKILIFHIFFIKTRFFRLLYWTRQERCFVIFTPFNFHEYNLTMGCFPNILEVKISWHCPFYLHVKCMYASYNRLVHWQQTRGRKGEILAKDPKLWSSVCLSVCLAAIWKVNLSGERESYRSCSVGLTASVWMQPLESEYSCLQVK